MNFENYITVITYLHSLSLGEQVLLGKKLVTKQHYECAINTGDGGYTVHMPSALYDQLLKVHSDNDPPREFHTRLGLVEARIVLPKIVSYNESNEHYIQTANQSDTFNVKHKNRGNNIMKNLIFRAILTFIALTMLGFAFVNFGGVPVITFTPVAGISLFWRKDNNSTSKPELPEPYQGIRSNTSREQYIAEKVKQVDQSQAYKEKVNQVTFEAKEQWDEANPSFSEIQSLIADTNYCDLVGVYLRDGLQSTEAIENSLIALIRDEGTIQDDGVILLEDTIGDFIDDALDIHCLDCHIQSSEFIDVVMSIKDKYNVAFKDFTPPSETHLTVVEQEQSSKDDDITSPSYRYCIECNTIHYF